MAPQTLWYLKQVDLFKDIPEEEIMALATSLVERRCEKREVLYAPMELNDSIYILKSGVITLYHQHRGKKYILDVLHGGAIFGNFSFDPEAHDHYAEVTESAYLCIFSLDDFLKIIQSRPEVLMRLLKSTSQRMVGYERKLRSGLFDAKEKILSELESAQKNRGSFLKKIFSPPHRLTHELLAQYTGLSRETVTRALKELKNEGVVQMGKHGIERVQESM